MTTRKPAEWDEHYRPASTHSIARTGFNGCSPNDGHYGFADDRRYWRERAIRVGTDGSKLSFMGLPTPNLFAGEQNFHSPHGGTGGH